MISVSQYSILICMNIFLLTKYDSCSNLSNNDLNVASLNMQKKIRELINELSRMKFFAYEAKEALVKEMGEGRRGRGNSLLFLYLIERNPSNKIKGIYQD